MPAYTGASGQWKPLVLRSTPAPGGGGTDPGTGGGTGGGTGMTLAWDYTDTNPPWTWPGEVAATADWPPGVVIVDLIRNTGDLQLDIQATLATTTATSVVIRLGAGLFHMPVFRHAGGGTGSAQEFGLYLGAKLRGLLGAGADKTTVQLDPNAYTQVQLDTISAMTTASYAPLLNASMRLDPTNGSPLVCGINFQAAPQQSISYASDIPATSPQPAPHQGLVLYRGSAAIVSYCRFQAFGCAHTSSPPFEMANITGARSDNVFHHNESDGRTAASLDPARTRKCSIFMANSENTSTLRDMWLHHSNVSRYAVNDENQPYTYGTYIVTRCKFEQITNTKNDGHLGYTNASIMGWESVAGTIALTDVIASVDNPYVEGGNQGSSQHIQFTNVNRIATGGRMTITRGVWRNTGFPQLDGYLTARVTSGSDWYKAGLDTTITAMGGAGGTTRLKPYVYSGTWPPSAATLSVAGTSPNTHYLVRTT